MKPEHFTHLHAHSCYSTKDGSVPIPVLVDRQIENGASAVACTDHGNMTSAWFLFDYIHNVKGYDAKHIIGCELYLSTTRDELFDWLPTAKEDCPDKDARATKRKQLAKRYHQIVLAKNKTGYFNAVHIHNEAWKSGFYYNPMTTKDVIFSHSDGLIATTTCLGSIWNQMILAGNIEGARKEIEEWKAVFGEDFFVELQPTNNETQRLVNIELIRLAKLTDTPMIVTNDVHYIDEADHELHFTLLNLDNLKSDKPKGKLWEFDVDDLYLKSLDQMHAGWKRVHKGKEFSESVFEGCIESIGSIIERVEHYTLESAPLLPAVDDQDPLEKLKVDAVAGLAEKVRKGLIPAARLQEYQDRLIEEISVMSLLGAENYINICALITSWCKDNNIGVGLGRGSAPSSLVLWVLGITDIDPIRYSLLFERFLNRNRRPKLLM